MNTIIGLCLILACSASVKSDDISDSLEQTTATENPKDYFAHIHQADLFEFPYHVALVETNAVGETLLVCQGALINRNWFITSAFCLWKYYSQPKNGNFTTNAVMGTRDYTYSQATNRSLTYYAYHPYFNKTTNVGYDVALCMFNEPLSVLFFVGIIKIQESTEIVQTNCIFSSYLKKELYWNNADKIFDYDCKLMNATVDDNDGCWIMNKTLLIENEINNSFGSPFMCDNKLYAIQGKNGLTTVLNIKNWVHNVMAKAYNYIRHLESEEQYSHVNSNRDLGLVPIVKMNNKNPSILDSLTNYVKPILENSVINTDRFEIKMSSEDNSSDDDHIFNHNGNTKSSSQEENEDQSGTTKHQLTTESPNRNITALRQRRKTNENEGVENMFLSWAQTVSRLKPMRQVELKLAIGQLVNEAQVEDLDEKINDINDRDWKVAKTKVNKKMSNVLYREKFMETF